MKYLLLIILLFPFSASAVTPAVIYTDFSAANAFYMNPNTLVMANHTLRDNVNGPYTGGIRMTQEYTYEYPLVRAERYPDQDIAIIRFPDVMANKQAETVKCSEAKVGDNTDLNIKLSDDENNLHSVGKILGYQKTTRYFYNLTLSGNIYLSDARGYTGQSGGAVVDSKGGLIGMMNFYTADHKQGGIACKDLLALTNKTI